MPGRGAVPSHRRARSRHLFVCAAPGPSHNLGCAPSGRRNAMTFDSVILAAATKSSSGLTTAQWAALAAVAAAITGALVGAVLQSRRERNNWVREARAAIYLEM